MSLMHRSRSRLGALTLGLSVLAAAGCAPDDSRASQTRQLDERARNDVAQSSDRTVAADTTFAASLSAAFRGAADRNLRSVVFVTVERPAMVAQGQQQIPLPDFFRRFFEFNVPQQMPEDFTPPPRQGSGSGFIFDDEGHILTNHHVVDGAESILVRTHDGREYRAEVIGSDPSTDVAVLRVEGADLPEPVTFGDSDALLIGDWVLALGNPLGLDFTVTSGIVSAKRRQLTGRQSAVESFIQTDAAINPGNSGGPLVDLAGRVVGINTAIFGAQRFVGYGFAVPINLAREVVADILEYGYARRPRLGVGVQPVTAVDAEAYGLAEVRGAEVVTVDPDAPAGGKLEVGDVILAVNGTPIEDSNALIANLARRDPGDEVTLTIVRDRQQREVRVELGEFEREEAVPVAGPRDAAASQPLGIRAEPVTPALAERFGLEVRDGVVVTAVERYSDAARAGIRPGQVIRRVNGQVIADVADLRAALEDLGSGDVASVRVIDPEVGETIVNFRLR